MNDLITADPTATMSSLEIATLCGKKHFHVLRDIRTIIEQINANPDLDSFDFKEEIAGNGAVANYHLPKRETLILTSGYKVAQRAAIIDRWLELEALPTDPLDLIIHQATEMKRVKAEQRQQKAQIAVHEAKIERIEVEHQALSGKLEQYSVKAMAAIKNISGNAQQANQIGREASRISREAGRAKGQVRDPVYGRVGAYDEDVLERAFGAVVGCPKLQQPVNFPSPV